MCKYKTKLFSCIYIQAQRKMDEYFNNQIKRRAIHKHIVVQEVLQNCSFHDVITNQEDRYVFKKLVYL